MTRLDSSGDAQFSSRSDPVTGAVEHVGFLDCNGQRMFGCTHVPRETALGGVVICSPVLAEFARNYRKEVLLARSLCARGFAVQRFHYRGSGNSDGENGEATWDSMVDDAVAAGEWLRRRTGVTRLAHLGARWGGLIAAAAAGRRDGTPLGLWEPTVDASRSLREVIRARLMSGIKEGARDRPSREGLLNELSRKGSLDIFGYAVDLNLYESVAGRALADVLGDRPRPILLIQISRRPSLRPEYAGLMSKWEAMGFPVETHAVEGEEAWWFTGGRWEPEETREMTKQLLTTTTDWMALQLAGDAGSS